MVNLVPWTVLTQQVDRVDVEGLPAVMLLQCGDSANCSSMGFSQLRSLEKDCLPIEGLLCFSFLFAL